MGENIENHTIRLLQEIRGAQQASDAKLDAFIASADSKLNKLGIELLGVKGRIRKVEEAVEIIAHVMNEGASG